MENLIFTRAASRSSSAISPPSTDGTHKFRAGRWLSRSIEEYSPALFHHGGIATPLYPDRPTTTEEPHPSFVYSYVLLARCLLSLCRVETGRMRRARPSAYNHNYYPVSRIRSASQAQVSCGNLRFYLNSVFAIKVVRPKFTQKIPTKELN